MSQPSDEPVGKTGREAEPSGELRPGDALGRFTIEAVIGQGGMGRVYRARDSTLDRAVAIKLVPAELLEGRGVEQRFEREAQLLASLQHPHVATLFDFVADGPHPFLAMELVEGLSLAELVREERLLEPRRALDITSQVASALAAAHEAGVIHRDIKPDNIKLAADGRVKVLDFGLARMTREDERGTEAPTAILPTRPGTVLGTAPYMSPEQARGQELDERTDIWSLGCVLFELLSGERAFSGATASDTMAAVIKEDPDWSRLPATLPATVSRLLRRMLHKERRGRLRDAGDIHLAIEDLLAEGLSEGSGAGPEAPGTRSTEPVDSREGAGGSSRRVLSAPWLLAATAAGLVLGALVGAQLSRRSKAESTGDPVRHLVIPVEGSLTDNGRPAMALSPDGRQLAYIGVDHNGQSDIWLRPLDAFEARPLDGGSPLTLFWSPDSRSIGYADPSASSLRRIALDGGASTRMTDLIEFMGADWARDGSVLVSDTRGLNRIDPSGRVDTLMSGIPAWPQQLDDGAILFTRQTAWGHQSVVHYSADGNETLLVDNAFFARLIDDQLLLFARSGTLYAAPVELATLAVDEPRLVLDGVLTNDIFGTAAVSLSADGTLAWVPAQSSHSRVMTIDRAGNTEPIGDELGAQFMPRASPDGRYVTLTVLSDGEYDIWRIDLERGTFAPWITEGSTPLLAWSPQGDRVAYSSWRDAVGGLYVRQVDSPEETLLHSFEEGELGHPISWGVDNRILLSFAARGSSEDVVAISADDGTFEFLLDSSELGEQAATLSPDGRLLAWGSDDGIFLRTAGTDPGSPTLVANEGRMPRWSPEGRRLYFLTGERSRRLMEIEVESSADGRLPSHSEPRLLFEHEFGGSIGFGLHRYDVLPGDRFVFVTPDLRAEPEIRVQLGWLDEVKRGLTEP